MITAHAWTRGCVTTAGGYDWLADLPMEIRVVCPTEPEPFSYMLLPAATTVRVRPLT